jgi:two-component system, sensor histidine kinase and response regulator
VTLSSASILIVDDEPNNFDVIEILLAREAYNLNYAADSAEAFHYLNHSLPDVLLLDVMMPGVDGLELCRRIKSNPAWCHLPILMVTALNSKEDLAHCLESGADDFISKPVNGVELRARIRSMLRIKQQQDALKSTLQLREDLSNMIVHDLRNPLASILLACELLNLMQLPPKPQHKVEQIKMSGRQLQSLVDSLLIMAKLEAGKMLLNRTDVDLVQLGQQVIADFTPLAAQKRIEIEGRFPECEPKVWSIDATIFRRILDNLLSNAIKFSPGGSQITLQVEYPNPQVGRIQVIDKGKGIPDIQKEQIFEKFETGDLVQGVMQTGLGLAFCKLAIDAHQGQISVHDNQPQGSIFRLEITADG